MRNCAVPFCKNRGPIKDLRYFRFTLERRDAWMVALNRCSNDIVSLNSSICSEHFAPECIEMKENKMFLKPGAVPTLKLKPMDVRKAFYIKHCERNNIRDTFQPASTNEITVSEDLSGRGESTDSTETDSIKVESDQDVVVSRTLSNSSSSDSEDFKGIAKKRGHVLKMMHNYCMSPSKLSKSVVDLKKENSALKKKLRQEKLRVNRLKKNVVHLKDVVKQLKRQQRNYLSH